MQIASLTKGNLFREFHEIIIKIEKLYFEIQKDAERLGYQRVLCHNDTYAPNYLRDDEENVYLIDWEYAGLNYAANDIGCILCRYDWSDEQIARYLKAYMGRTLTAEEHRFFMRLFQFQHSIGFVGDCIKEALAMMTAFSFYHRIETW